MYWQHFNHYYPGYNIPRVQAIFEPPNVQQFKLSAQSFITPVHELQILLNAIAHHDGYAEMLMNAARNGKKDVVKKLIQSLGIHSPFVVKYNPDGISVTFQPKNTGACFNVSTSLCW